MLGFQKTEDVAQSISHRTSSTGLLSILIILSASLSQAIRFFGMVAFGSLFNIASLSRIDMGRDSLCKDTEVEVETELETDTEQGRLGVSKARLGVPKARLGCAESSFVGFGMIDCVSLS